MSTTVTITGGTAPEVTVSDAGASVSVPSASGVISLNGLSGAVTLAVVGGTIAAAGNTLTLTVTGGGASSWGDLTGKPFTTLGTGLSVVAGVLSATGLAIADTTGLQAALDLKAPLASPTFTGTVGGITKSMVGLGSVDNTADASKPVSTDQAAADAAVQAYAIQRANHTGTQAASTVSVVGGYPAFSPSPMTVEGALSSISGALENKADSSPATTSTLGPIIVGTGLAVTSGTVSLAATAVTAAAYGSASSVATFTVGADGRLTAAGSTAIAIAAAAVSGLAAVATSGAYADLSGKPTIPNITSGTAAPTGGSSGDIYLRYTA